MAEDKEVLKEVWDGKIPICFKLSPEDVHISEPDEFYLMVSRQTYFPLIYDKVQKNFVDHVSPTSKTNEIWLEFNGIPLKWHYPVGLLYDLYMYDSEIETTALPWSIHVHFDNFPEEELLHCPNKETIEAHFMSTLKEAASLKNRGKVIHDMQDRAHKQLWKGFQTENFEQFWSINKKLMDIGGDVETSESFKFIPFRIYLLNQSFIQKLFNPINESGEKRALKDLLQSVLNSDYFLDKKVIIQGIQPSLNTPVQWLSEHLSYPDNFLHIVIK